MNTITINVIESNGMIDEAAMKKEFLAKVAAVSVAHCTPQIASAVNAAFDSEDRGQTLFKNRLVSKTITALKVAPKLYTKWEKLISDYIRVNSEGNDPLFIIGKGTNGGVSRRADLEGAAGSNSKPVEPATEQKIEAADLEAAA
jgi:hypothetical protein